MKTLGIEMTDAGFEVAVGRSAPPNGRATAERLAPPGTVAAIALSDGAMLHFGAAAEERRFLFPRQMCDVFWEELSLNQSNISQAGRPLSYSELSYHFLRHIVDGLPGVASEHESLVIALPSGMLDGGDREDERVGLLLGICGDLELKLSAVVDAACAALLDPESVAPARGTVLLVDLGLHGAMLSVLDLGTTISRQACSRLPGAGWLALTDLARRTLADRFLRQTSFDVMADRRTEQVFHLQALGALTDLTTQQEAWLRVVSGARERAISVPREAMAGDLRALSETIAHGAKEILLRMGLNISGVQVCLTARARHLCGLAKALRANGAIAVSVLTAGAAARGAAVLACHRPRPPQIEDVSVETAMALPESIPDSVSALRAAFALKRHAAHRDAVPSHVVVDGMAHPLRPSGLRVAAGLGQGDRDLSVPITPAGVGPCEIVIEAAEGRWQVSVLVAGVRHPLPGIDSSLAPGDILEIHGNPGVVRLLFVRLVRH